MTPHPLESAGRYGALAGRPSHRDHRRAVSARKCRLGACVTTMPGALRLPGKRPRRRRGIWDLGRAVRAGTPGDCAEADRADNHKIENPAGGCVRLTCGAELPLLCDVWPESWVPVPAMPKMATTARTRRKYITRATVHALPRGLPSAGVQNSGVRRRQPRRSLVTGVQAAPSHHRHTRSPDGSEYQPAASMQGTIGGNTFLCNEQRIAECDTIRPCTPSTPPATS